MAGDSVNLLAFLKTAWLWADARAVWWLIIGLTAAVGGNALLWRRDRRLGEAAQASAEATHPLLPPDARPRVSLLIPAWNEAELLPTCLDSVLALRYPEKEVIVCAGGPDGTLEVARRYADRGVVVLEQQPGEGKQRALQQCFARSTGNIIFLTDADCVLDDASFEQTLVPVINGAEAATGSRRPLDAQRRNPLVVYQWLHHLFLEGHLPDEVDVLFGINAALRRDILERVGGFSVPVAIGTDYTLAQQLRKAGHRIRFVRSSRVQTEYVEKLSVYLRQRSRWFRNRLVYGLRFRAWWDVFSHLWAGLTSLFMLAVPLTGGLGARWLWALWLAGLVHLLLSQARVIRFARLQGVSLPGEWTLFSFALYMVFGWGATVWGLIETLLPGRRWRW